MSVIFNCRFMISKTTPSTKLGIFNTWGVWEGLRYYCEQFKINFFHIKVKCDSSGLNCPMDRVLEINIIHLVGSILGKTCSLIICYFT